MLLTSSKDTDHDIYTYNFFPFFQIWDHFEAREEEKDKGERREVEASSLILQLPLLSSLLIGGHVGGGGHLGGDCYLTEVPGRS